MRSVVGEETKCDWINNWLIIYYTYTTLDGTAEFISGVKGDAKPGHGLSCVTVLIGAYLRSSGKPVIGIVNQPFYQQ